MLKASNPAPNALFLEDLRVGQRFSSGSHTLDEAQIKEFAAQFDPQPFHLDGETAKGTLFGGLAASGWHTAAITMKLLVEPACRSAEESSEAAEKSAGRSRRDQATRSPFSAKSKM